MIHTASLFHDDVIDKASTRRNVASVNQVFGNKLAVLGGDFLLSRASVSLARLRNLEVVELLSAVIEHLVKGEIMQMKPTSSGRSQLEYYLRKNFYKTASLMGHSCLAAAVLGESAVCLVWVICAECAVRLYVSLVVLAVGCIVLAVPCLALVFLPSCQPSSLCPAAHIPFSGGHSEECKRASYLYGTYIGQAFQLIDDALDFEGSTASLGKAPLADLKSGLATAPTLFAAEEHPHLLELISRKFASPGDVDEALLLVQRSNGLQKCKDLAQVHAERAVEALEEALPPSAARDSLKALACKVVTRTH